MNESARVLQREIERRTHELEIMRMAFNLVSNEKVPTITNAPFGHTASGQVRVVPPISREAPTPIAAPRRKMSAARRKKLSIAAKKRWAEKNAGKTPVVREVVAKKRTMSAAGKKAISVATKARWAKFHALQAKGKTRAAAA